jgi:hypothetical protein
LNMEENFMAMSPAANQSRGNRSFAEWTHNQKLGMPVDPTFRAEMMKREIQLRTVIQRRIDGHINAGNVVQHE